jgi:hypothetical protein
MIPTGLRGRSGSELDENRSGIKIPTLPGSSITNLAMVIHNFFLLLVPATVATKSIISTAEVIRLNACKLR